MDVSKQIRDSSPKAVLNDLEFFLILRESIVSAWKNVIGGALNQHFTSLNSLATFKSKRVSQEIVFDLWTRSLSLEKIIIVELFQRLNVPFKDSKGVSYAYCVFAAFRAFLARKSVIDR